MALTPQELQIIEFGKQSGKSKMEVQAALADYRASQQAQAESMPAEPSLAERVGNVVEHSGQQMRQAITGEGEFAGESPLARGFGAGAAGARGVVGTAFQALPGFLRRPIESVGEFAGEQFGKVTGALAGTEFVQQAAGATGEDGVYVPSDLGFLEEGLKIAQRAGEVADVTLGAGLGPKAVTQGAASSVNLARNIASNTFKAGKSLAERATPKTWRAALYSNAPDTRAKAIDTLEDAYQSGLVKGRKATNNKLDNLAAANSFGGTTVTRDMLIRELAEEGYVPKIDGDFAKFDDVFDDISNRQRTIMENLDQDLAPLQGIENQTSLARLREAAESTLRESPQVGAGLTASLSQLDRLFKGLAEKYGDRLDPIEINNVRKEMNKISKAYRTKAGDKVFELDAADAVGKAARSRLDDVAPAIKAKNAEWARLERVAQTAKVLNNEIVEVGLLGRKLGSYVGTIGASLAGLSIAGPGGLVVASIFAQLGSDALATLLRSRKFDPKLRKAIVENISKDPKAVKKLVDEASPENKSFLASLFTVAKENLDDPAMRQGGGEYKQN